MRAIGCERALKAFQERHLGGVTLTEVSTAAPHWSGAQNGVCAAAQLPRAAQPETPAQTAVSSQLAGISDAVTADAASTGRLSPVGRGKALWGLQFSGRGGPGV